MSSLPEIEIAIAKLPKTQARKLLEWLQVYLDDAWDRQIEADIKLGRLNSLLQRAEADIAANRTKPIDGLGHMMNMRS
ncbi:hypothetical protein GS682_03975 [Nostoc sp. B(2019)]|nr:hypothetical protein [Nostoc sp. B(2019)]